MSTSSRPAEIFVAIELRCSDAELAERVVAEALAAGATGTEELEDPEGLRFIVGRPPVATVILVKAGWGIAGSATLFLSLFGERFFAIAGRPDLGVALMLAARATACFRPKLSGVSPSGTVSSSPSRRLPSAWSA